MFKTKLIAAAMVLGFGGAAHAAISNGVNGEFFFSAYDKAAGFGYTFDLSDAGFNSIFGSDVRMNSLIGAPASTSAPGVNTSLVSAPANGVLFDLALPTFSTFLTSVNASGVSVDLTKVQWNLVSLDNSGIRRLVTTAATPISYTNGTLKAAVDAANIYSGQVNSKLSGDDDGYGVTTSAMGTAWAGYTEGDHAYKNAVSASLATEMALYAFGQTTQSTTNTNLALTAAGGALTSGVTPVVAKVYQAADGYHLQIALAPVPEPETYAMLLAGLGLLGFAARRKNA